MYDINDPSVWVGYADHSYIATRILSLTYLMDEAPVSAHRTIELYLKAYLVSNRRPMHKGTKAWGHQVNSLRRECEKHDPDFSNIDLSRRISFYQRYFDFVRYPGESDDTWDCKEMYWFGFESCILPLDEVVSFVRPRIILRPMEWRNTWLRTVYKSDREHLRYQKRALIHHNFHIKQIACLRTGKPMVSFDQNFSFDQPGC